MSPQVWLTILFVVLTVTAYLLWVLELLPGVRVLVTLLAIVSFVLAVVFYQFATPTAGEHDVGWARPPGAIL